MEGTFVFTVLDGEDNVYFVKGDNPLCLYHYPNAGFYIYASTEEILKKALRRLKLPKEKLVRILLMEGDIFRIDANGEISTSTFEVKQSEYALWCVDWRRFGYPYVSRDAAHGLRHADYAMDLKSVATAYGYSREDIDELLQIGYSLDELEELLYCGEL